MNLINKVFEVWFRLDRRIRFILVGGYNSVFGYVVFALLELLLRDRLHYLVSLCLAYFISIFNSFFSFRIFVFCSKGKFLHEYIKVSIVYLGYLLLNMTLLYFFKSIIGVNIFIAQIICILILSVLSYFIHKNFSFKNEEKIT